MPLTTKTKHFLTWFVPLVLVVLLIPSSFYATPLTGAAPSWAIALHLAVKDHLVFGRDVISRSGPLAVLLFRLPIFLNKYLFLLSDVFFYYVLFVAFREIFRLNGHYGQVLFLFACVLVCQYLDIEKWYFFLTLFFLFSFLGTPARNSNLIHAGLLSLICLYIYPSILYLFIFPGTVIYGMVSRKVRWLRGAVILDAWLVALLVSSWVLHTNLPGYIIGSVHLMKDYENVMYLPLAGRSGSIAGWSVASLIVLFFACYALLLTKWLRKGEFRKELDLLFIYFVVAAGIFIWYKRGFVRADDHVLDFFEMAALLTLLLYVFTPAGYRHRAIGICCWTILAADILVTEILPGRGLPDSYGNLVTGALVPVKFREVSHYFGGFEKYDKQLAHYQDIAALPNEYRDVIGSHTTDIIPSEISTIFFNGLNYDPRPTLQSYMAYDRYLDSLNYAHYLSPGAPEYVLLSLDGKPDRFAWTDESRVKLALLQRYRFVQTIGDQLLLRRRETPRRLIKMKVDTVKVKLGEEVQVKRTAGDQIEFTRFIIHYDHTGKLRSLLYQPPPLQMLYRTDDGGVYYHTAYIPVYGDGIILNKFVDNTREFQLFLLSDGRLNARVRSFRIQTQGGYSPDITMINTWYTVGDRSPAEQREDSLHLLRLIDGNAMISPLPKPPLDPLSSSVRYGIDSYHDEGGLVRLQGWAIPEHGNDSDHAVRAVARSANGLVYPFFSRTSDEHDLPADLRQRTDLDSAGFLAILSKSQLPAGNYQVGLALYNRLTGGNLVSYTDKYFDVDNKYALFRVAGISTGSSDKDSIRSNIDSIGSDDEGLHIEGWAVLAGARTATATALLFRNDTATYRLLANPRRRQDIMAVYRNPSLQYCGFQVNLAWKDQPKGVFSLGLGIVSPDGTTRSWKFTDRKVRMGIPGRNVPVRVSALPPPADFTSNIDMASLAGGMIQVRGWAIGDTARDNGDVIQVVLQGEGGIFVSAPVKKEFRADVAARLNPQVANCGFDEKVATDPMPLGEYRLGLLIHQPGRTGSVRFYDKTIRLE